VSKDIFNFDRSSLNLLQLSTIAGLCTILRVVYPCPTSEDFVPQYRIIAGMAMWTEVKNGFCFGHNVVFVLHEKKVSGFCWVSKIFLDFFPVAVRRCLVFAPTAPAVVATRQRLKVKIFQRSGLIFLEVGENYLSSNFRLENVAVLCLHARVFEVRGADLVQAESTFFLVDGFRIIAGFNFRDSVEKSVEIGSLDRERDE